MISKKHVCAFLFAAGFSQTAIAKGSVEGGPIAVYETNKYTNGANYYQWAVGIRGTASVSIFGLDIEATRVLKAGQALITNETTLFEDKIKVGGRIAMGGRLKVYLRGGAQATRGLSSTDLTGTHTINSDFVFHPYAGTGIVFKFTPNFGITAGVDSIFNQWPDTDNINYHASFGFVVSSDKK